MMRIAALNDASQIVSDEEDVGPSQEVLEADATRIYRKAIHLMANEEFINAKSAFEEVLCNPYIAKAEWADTELKSKNLPQDIALKYSCYKNLGQLYMEDKAYKDAHEYYLKAIELDSTEVTVWQKLGSCAIKMKDFQLALIAFQEGLIVNPNHWPCLDQLLSVLFILSMYEDCLSLILQALKRDRYYVKALAFKEKIFELQPSLIKFTKEYFTEWEILFRDISYDRVKGDSFISTCLALRPPPKDIMKPPVLSKSRNLVKGLKTFSWANLAEVLIHTYDTFILDEPGALVAKLEINSLFPGNNQKSSSKTKLDLTSTFEKLAKRISRSASCNDAYLLSKFGSMGTSGEKNKIIDVAEPFPSIEEKVSLKRRRSFDDFSDQINKEFRIRVNSDVKIEKMMVDDEEEKEISGQKQMAFSEDAKCIEVLPCKMQKANSEDILRTSSDDQLSQQDTDTSVKDEQQNTNSENESENCATNSQNEDEDIDRVDGSSQELLEEFIGEGTELISRSQGAKSQLEEIISLRPHNQLVNSSANELGSAAEDFLKLLSEVNYDEVGTTEDVDFMNKDFSLLEDSKVDKDSEENEDLEKKLNGDEGCCNSNDGQLLLTEDNEVNGANIINRIVLPEKLIPDTSVSLKVKSPMKNSCNITTDVEIPQESSQSQASTSAKKPKRPKRGLERELEQLDYWGRRKAREAKRRRRTLTSKLVGEFGDSENLTWAHLIKSFIPSSLLTYRKDSGATALGSSLSDLSKNDSSPTSQESNVDENAKLLEKKVIEEEDCHTDRNKDKNTANNLGSTVSEDTEVSDFLDSVKQNGGILSMMQLCSRHLISKCGLIWPKKLALAYKDLYARIRKHITVGATLNPNEDPKRLFEFANSALIHVELLLSLNSLENGDSFQSEDDINMEEILRDEDLHIEDDLFDLHLLLTRPDVWNEEYLQAHFRLGLIQFQLKTLLAKPEEAAFCLQVLIDQMEISKLDDSNFIEVKRCHVSEDNFSYDLSYFRNQLNLLQRSQILEKIEPKFLSGHYEEVVDILTSVMSHPKANIDTSENLPSKHSQLIMLTESLVETGSTKSLVEWGGKCLNEALSTFCTFEADFQEKTKWSFAVRKILLLIFEAVWDDTDIVSEPPSEHLISLVSYLVKVLVVQLEQGANLPQPYFDTLCPWIALHLILSQHEQNLLESASSVTSVVNKIVSSSVKSDASDENSLEENSSNHPRGLVLDKCATDPSLGKETEDAGKKLTSEDVKEKMMHLSQSSLLLITAHDELGKNKWCCVEDGKFLLYLLNVLLSELEKPLINEQRLTLDQAIEQVIFCLYSHPSKKTKYKHLRDHGGQPIPLSWERALQLYHYYTPYQLPEFQSAKYSSITDDVSVLIRRIVSLIPEEFKCEDQTKSLDGYIEGHIPYSDISSLQSFPDEIRDCFYLLGDYYFKGKDWSLAIHYYKLDLSINPSRIDSWAPMGLARKAQLEMLLNSCDIIKSNEGLINEAHRALRSLDGGLHIDQYFSNLWVEKGGLVYMIHSYSSRVLKQELNTDISIEMFQSLERIKNKMLKLSEECFNKASKIVQEGWDDEELPDETWLYQYMLGKVAEKNDSEPKEVLRYYIEACRRLHVVGAKYPSKISYNNPPNHSIEALEMFYRINVYIFKCVSNSKGGNILSLHDLRFFYEILKRLENSPFVLMDSKMVLDNENFIDIDALYSLTSNTTDVVCNTDRNDEEAVEIISKKDKVAKDKSKFEKTSKSTEQDIDSKNEKDSDKELSKIKSDIIDKCLEAFHLCVTRFSHHYKSLYRLAHFYYHSIEHKDNSKSRNLLLGCDSWQSVAYMPSSGLFSDRKVSAVNLKNSNWFHSIWRIPHDEIDRPGSFAAHMYRCVSLCLDVLQETKEFYTVLELALALKNSPDKDKKYLRDNERELLSEHATQVGIQCMKEKYRLLFKNPPLSKDNCRTFILQVYRAYKQMTRHFNVGDSTFSKMLTEAYASFLGVQKDNQFNLLKEAENFCIRNRVSLNSDSSSNYSSSSGTRPVGSQSYSPANINRRGRPPSFVRNFSDSSRSKLPQESSNPTSGQSLAVQQAYKVYENLIQAQAFLNNKNLDSRNTEHFQKKCDELKRQMLKYLQIPSVSQFFRNSLQSLGTSEAKLPPPPAHESSDASKHSIGQDKSTDISASEASVPSKKHTLAELAAKSKLHGISISHVPKGKDVPEISEKLKPDLTISKLKSPTSSPKTKTTMALTITKVKNDDISTSPSFGKTSSSASSSQPGVTITPVLSKLPLGTTLSKKNDSSDKIIPASSNEFVEQNSSDELTNLSKKPNITVTQKVLPKLSAKSDHTSSFQAAFLASISNSNINSTDDTSPIKKKNIQHTTKSDNKTPVNDELSKFSLISSGALDKVSVKSSTGTITSKEQENSSKKNPNETIITLD